MEQSERSYVPAAGQHWLLPLYDPLLWIMRGTAIKRPLIEQAAVKPGFRVLDVGCGTGSLAVLIKRSVPQLEVIGLDPEALAIAAKEAERARLSVKFERGFSDSLGYADCVVRSRVLIFHVPPPDAGGKNSNTFGDTTRLKGKRRTSPAGLRFGDWLSLPRRRSPFFVGLGTSEAASKVDCRT